jgi:shikimate 5-dehydrogenase
MKFGLIGHPIEHSLSPALFKAGYDGRYPYELIQTDDFEEAYARFLKEYDGINVTAPFKELAIRKADILSEECQAIGATNLLVKTPEGIKAYNSDYLGVRLWIEEISRLASLARNDREEAARNDKEETGRNDREEAARNDREEDGRNDRMTRVLIVGLGGAGKAAKAAAESLGFDTSIINRTQYTPEIKSLKDFRQEFLKADIIIYNLPVRINEIDELTQDDLSYCGRKVILEANYRNPSFDKELIAKLKEHHHMLEYTGGETWLLLQALTGYEIFTGEKPDLEKMTACL